MANQFQNPNFPSVVLSDSSNDSLQRAMVQVIGILQILTAPGAKTRSGSQPDRHMQHTFIQTDTPTAYNPGDFWLGDSTFNVWTGDRWQKIATLPTS
jgi:hypothetical protein